MKKAITVICYTLFIIIWVWLFQYGLLFLSFNKELFNPLTVTLFILASIAIIASPFYLKIKNPKKAIIALILTVLIAVSFVLTSQGLSHYYSEFTPTKWSEETKLRYRMLDSLESQYKLEGMTENEVKELLGEPEYIRENGAFLYYTGGWIYYVVDFENGVVINTSRFSD